MREGMRLGGMRLGSETWTLAWRPLAHRHAALPPPWQVPADHVVDSAAPLQDGEGAPATGPAPP